MSRIALYRVLYGEDFVQESIRSILPYMDRVLVAMAPRPWGTSTGIEWGQHAAVDGNGALTVTPGWIPWPARFDNTANRIAELEDERIEVITDYHPTPRGQHTHLINDIILPRYGACEVVIMEPDCVFHDDEIARAVAWWQMSSATLATVDQVELWRTPQWRIPERRRDAVWFLRLNGPIGMTGGNGWIEGMGYARLPAHVHNFGFCSSERTMLWKHLTALAFSAEIGDALPNPDWYERVWLNWKPGDTNLEISRGEEHTIPAAYPYPVEELPALIREKYGI